MESAEVAKVLLASFLKTLIHDAVATRQLPEGLGSAWLLVYGQRFCCQR